MSPIPKSFKRGISRGGLKKRREIRVGYCAATDTVLWVEGADVEPKEVGLSEVRGFNLPLHVIIDGVPLFPTTYEIIHTGEIVYHAPSPPAVLLKVPEAASGLHERSKVMRVTLTPSKLEELKSCGHRPRKPTQDSVMGEKASIHADKLIAMGRLICDETNVSWHWNHLIAFSLLPTKRAQSKNNLFCGTAAVNGQMTNIETAVTAWVFEKLQPLSLEVTCVYLMDSHLALRLRYRLYNKKTGGIHTEYYDTLSTQYSEYGDLDAVYDRMCKNLS